MFVRQCLQSVSCSSRSNLFSGYFGFNSLRRSHFQCQIKCLGSSFIGFLFLRQVCMLLNYQALCVSQCMLSGYQPPCISMHAVRVSTPCISQCMLSGYFVHAVRVSTPVYLNACCPGINPRVSQCMLSGYQAPLSHCMLSEFQPPCISMHACCPGIKPRYLAACCPGIKPRYLTAYCLGIIYLYSCL